MAKKQNEAVSGALKPHGFPHPPGPGLGFTPEDDERLAQGFPELRTITDEAVPLDRARESALQALDAIDPVLGYEVPRSVALHYLAGYSVGPNLFTDANHAPENTARRARREAVLAAPPAIDAALLRAMLREHHFQGMGDTYGRWRFAEVMFLYEALLGTETVAHLVVERALELSRDIAGWGFAGEKPQRTNAAAHHLALTLPWLLARLPSPVASELRAELDTGPTPDPSATRVPTAYFELLKRLAHPDAAPRFASPELDDELALRHPDLRALTQRVGRQGVLFAPARVAWLLGTAAFAGPLALGGHDAGRLVLQLSPLQDPGVVRLVAHAATQRNAQTAAAEWLQRHASYAAPVLRSLEKLADKKERAASSAALALLDAPIPAAFEPLSEDQVEAEIAALFGALGKELGSAKTKRARVSAIKAAYERYTEIRAAGGDPTPEAYFTHTFGDFGLAGWAMLAVEAVGGR